MKSIYKGLGINLVNIYGNGVSGRTATEVTLLNGVPLNAWKKADGTPWLKADGSYWLKVI